MNDYVNIIMAEDDLVTQKVTLRMLKKMGIRAKAVDRGKEFFEP
jgi:hypothetical protein